MSTFVLVHGACHSPWCWGRVASALRAHGHRTVAPSLPCDNPSADLHDYAAAVISAIETEGDVVLVGHSLGGLTIPVVAGLIPVSALVFVAGIVGAPEKSLAELADVDADRDLALGEDEYQSFNDGTFIFTQIGARRVLYHDCDPATTDEALRHLRPQRSLWNVRSPSTSWPDTNIQSIVCTQDRLVNPEWSYRVARERLGVEAQSFESGHTPMLAQPAALAELLLEITR